MPSIEYSLSLNATTSLLLSTYLFVISYQFIRIIVAKKNLAKPLKILFIHKIQFYGRRISSFA